MDSFIVIISSVGTCLNLNNLHPPPPPLALCASLCVVSQAHEQQPQAVMECVQIDVSARAVSTDSRSEGPGARVTVPYFARVICAVQLRVQPPCSDDADDRFDVPLTRLLVQYCKYPPGGEQHHPFVPAFKVVHLTDSYAFVRTSVIVKRVLLVSSVEGGTGSLCHPDWFARRSTSASMGASTTRFPYFVVDPHHFLDSHSSLHPDYTCK